MKSLIWVAVILQLVITGIKTDGQYQFGDIIEFPRVCIWKPTYSHFAVYVGPESGVNVSQGDNDIFHRTGKGKLGKPDCKFGKLVETRKKSKDRKNNYLDENLPGSYNTAEIKERLIQKKEQCDKYGLTTNNCEHFATFVRYGISFSVQSGTLAGYFLKKQIDQAKLQEIQARIDEVRNRDLDIIEETDENNNTLCSNDASKPDIPTGKLSACLVLLFCLLGGSCVWGFLKCFSIKNTRVYSPEGV